MEIVEDTEKGLVVLRPVGRLDASQAPDLERAILGAVEGGDTKLVIDLSEVPYISSRGLRVFLIGAKQAEQAGGRFAVCSPQDFVRKAFNVTGFHDLFDVFDSRAEAVDSFSTEGEPSAEPG